MGGDLPAGPAGPAQVELRLAGTFGVVRDGAELAGGEVGSRKSRTLLKLLAVERPGLVPVDRIVDVLWEPPAWRGSPEMERRRAFEAMTALLAGMAARSPVLLVLDDLQYAGRSSIEFIHYLGRHCSWSRLLAVVTLRAENDAEIGTVLAPVAARLDLGPLGPAAVEQLARAAGQGGLTDSILERTRGHTLFVVEVLRSLAAGDIGVPESLRNAIQARVRRTGARRGGVPPPSYS